MSGRFEYSAEICKRDHAADVPAEVLAALPKNQGHPVRHRCAACAYQAGLRDGTNGAAAAPPEPPPEPRRDLFAEPARRDEPDGRELTPRQRHWMCRLLLLMVAELHRRGYEQLRIAPYMAPSGMHWRCQVAPSAIIDRDHGAKLDGDTAAVYSSSEGERLFGWYDCARASPAELADRFAESFVEILEQARGRDAAYVRWYRDMLVQTEPLGMVAAFADHDAPEDRLLVVGETPAKAVSLPPPPLE